jgi:hypothetical protein
MARRNCIPVFSFLSQYCVTIAPSTTPRSAARHPIDAGTSAEHGTVAYTYAPAPDAGVMPNPYDNFHYDSWPDAAWNSVFELDQEAYWYHYMLSKMATWGAADWEAFAAESPDIDAYIRGMNETWMHRPPGCDQYEGPSFAPAVPLSEDDGVSMPLIEHVPVDTAHAAACQSAPMEAAQLPDGPQSAEETAVAPVPKLNSSHLERPPVPADSAAPLVASLMQPRVTTEHTDFGPLALAPSQLQLDSGGEPWADPDDVDDEGNEQAERWSRWLHERGQQLPVDAALVDTSSEVRSLCRLCTHLPAYL